MKRILALFLFLIGLMLGCGVTDSDCTHTTICDGYVSIPGTGPCPIIVAAGCTCTDDCE